MQSSANAKNNNGSAKIFVNTFDKWAEMDQQIRDSVKVYKGTAN